MKRPRPEQLPTYSRLSPTDIGAIQDRIDETLALWRATSMKLEVDATVRLALRRVGAGAIGCSEDDLRGAELTAIDTLVDVALDEETP